jgi:trimeric autotransporter adhesin
MSLSGDTLAIGASGEDSCALGVNGNQLDNSCESAGAVSVFARSGSTWSQQAYIKASNPDTVPRFFGQAVAVSGETLVVGAPGERSCALGINGNQMDTGCDNNGAVYIFTRSNNVWTQEAYVKASNHPRERLSGIGFNAVGFGSSVTLDGNTLAVGAVYEDGCSSGINGDETNNGCAATGAVYVFTRTDGVWAQQAYVKPSNTDTSANATGYQFGLRLALHGDNLVVGAPLEPSCATGINENQVDKGCPSAGAVYIFARTNNVWSQVAYVKATYPNLQAFRGSFGTSLAFDGTTLAVSAGDNNCARGFNPLPGSNECTAAGAAYLFSRTATNWAQRAYVKASNTDAYDFFGTSVAVAGNTLVVGAPTEDSCATGINGDQNDNRCTGTFREEAPNIGGAGAVYVYGLQ